MSLSEGIGDECALQLVIIRFDELLTPNLSGTYITNALILTPVFADLSVYFDWYLFLK